MLAQHLEQLSQEFVFTIHVKESQRGKNACVNPLDP